MRLSLQSVRYRVLGVLAAFTDDDTSIRLGGPRQRLVLGLLLRSVGTRVPEAALLDALWPGDPPTGARHTLQTYVSELRRILDDDIHRMAGGYVLDAARDTVDACRFEALAVAARRRMDGAPARTAALLREALALWQGHPYRERLHVLLMLALYRSSRQAEALGAYEQAKRVLAADLGIDPSPALQRLQRQILNQDPSLIGPPG
jgi:DNA-binding SARP family transcriptional activator